MDKGITFCEITDNGVAAVIIKQYKLPLGKFDHDEVSLLLLLPDGYPDASPDMFYVHPWIKVRNSDEWPIAAAARLHFTGTDWQRWSRHWSDWRPSTDGIQTWLLKVRHALESA